MITRPFVPVFFVPMCAHDALRATGLFAELPRLQMEYRASCCVSHLVVAIAITLLENQAWKAFAYAMSLVCKGDQGNQIPVMRRELMRVPSVISSRSEGVELGRRGREL